MRGLDVIAAGFDRSERGLDALALGELLARTVDAELLAVRVRERAEDDSLTEESLAAEVATRLAGSEVRRRTLVLGDRSASDALRDLAAAEPEIGLIAVGSTHRGAIGRVLPGGTAERLLHSAPCAVAVAPRGWAHEACPDPQAPAVVGERLRVVLVGYDATRESEAALELATRVALAAGATMRVVSVGPPYAGGWPEQESSGAQPVATAQRDLQSALHAAVRELPDELRALPVYERGEAPAKLLARAEEGVDLVVMGSRGHGPLQTAILGSTSTIVIGSAPCPVLVVPRPALAQA